MSSTEDEIVDVVNSSDEIIGAAPKSECHKLGLWHRSVFVFIFDSEGNLALQERSNKKSIRPGRVTASASGHVLRGESYMAAAKREMIEELGIDCALSYVLKTIGPYDYDREIIELYEGTTNLTIRQDKDEIAKILHMTLSEIAKSIDDQTLNWGESFKKVFRQYLEHKQLVSSET